MSTVSGAGSTLSAYASLALHSRVHTRGSTALGTPTLSGSLRISAKAKLDLLAGAVVGARPTVRETSAANFLQIVTNATTDNPTPARTSA